ncbi:kinesin motor domain protein [Ichthyophthirius multifiliis]|uniref:Kinesin-like protein n=1 Tax=Ichthyophthirius multifiliis TaxID=5932 RepID=G0QZX1_ICHMU|nr:kinesin motor domain protein [Ichthyophthirius multifiliis]EGR29233.1 kinesin motor domain protein [Ichthyophthirius multifiliis]|eukprot:XP_004030469.1 kinesin motor domain protein [Ichthyophthirius multifiliis]
MSVIVAVRVRPFNQREIDLNSQLCIDMDGPRTTLLCLEDSKKNKDFAFDYSFWSHDGFELDDNAWQGYHCCLFAYGQTGAGKSYSMVGYGANKGIVPIACQEIFKKIESNTNPNIIYEVQCSMLEIYNETVQDLLVNVTKRPVGGLKIRQNTSLGFYTDGLSKHPVEDYDQIEKLMDGGTQNRTVAATQMNASSSRAHTIIVIEFKQTETKDNNRKFEKLSVINLVDLAGSEKVGKTGAEGARLKEASNINQSLTTLGKVIQTLAEKEMGKSKGAVVPYRESCLTKILCNALGGNSKTLMICAVSPSSDNWEETLSTLRYADQAKKIKNKATVNESATDKLIRELTQENEKLKIFMQKFQEQFGINLDSMDVSSLQKLDTKQVNIQEILIKKEQMEANEHLLVDATKTKKQRIEENKQYEDQKPQIDLSKPYLTNIHEDPQLHNKIQCTLDRQKTIIGSKYAEPKADIIVGLTKHNIAEIVYENGIIFIQPIQGQDESFILLNGCPVRNRIELKNLDRLIFSTTSMFILMDQSSQSRTEGLVFNQIDFEFVQIERNKYMELENKLREQENEFRKQQDEEKKVEQQKLWEDEKKKLEEQIKQLQMQPPPPLPTMKKQCSEKINKYKDKNYLEHKLQKYLPKVLEINLIAKELKRKVTLQAKIAQIYEENEEKKDAQNIINIKSKVQIQVDNKELGQVYIWDHTKFNERYYMIKDLLEKYFETNTLPVIDPSNDPFCDPPEPHLIGNGYFKLLYLAYFMDSVMDLSIVGENGQCGSLNVSIIPCNETGDINLSEKMENESCEEIIEDPNQLLGRTLYFKINIQKAQLPEAFCKDSYVEYSLMDQYGKIQIYRTETIVGKNSKPNYNYSKIFCYENLNSEHLNYFMERNLVFKVFGFEEIQIDRKKSEVNNQNLNQKRIELQDGNSEEQEGKKKIEGKKEVEGDSDKKKQKQDKGEGKKDKEDCNIY